MNELLSDPEFLAWEHDRVGNVSVMRNKFFDLETYGEYITRFRCYPGPSSPRPETTQFASEMFSLRVDSRYRTGNEEAQLIGHETTVVRFEELNEEELKDAQW